MKPYLTKQRKLLLCFLKTHRDRQYTVEELGEALCALEQISVSSIYRNINAMVKEGMVRRSSAYGIRRFVYQYVGETCSEHIHLKCEHCGQIIHVEDKAVEEVLQFALRENHFQIDVSKTVIYGSCERCKCAQ